MKYPLQIAVVTIAVFGFMAMVIIDGTMTFGTPQKPSHFLHIQNLDTVCDLAELQGTRPDPFAHHQRMLKKIQARCNNLPVCTVDTSTLYEKGERSDNCTDEIQLTYSCSPDKNAKSIFLYENQVGTLTCETYAP